MTRILLNSECTYLLKPKKKIPVQNKYYLSKGLEGHIMNASRKYVKKKAYKQSA